MRKNAPFFLAARWNSTFPHEFVLVTLRGLAESRGNSNQNMGQKLGKTKDEIEKKFNDKKAAAAVVPPAASSSGSGGGKKSTLTPNENQQHPSGTITSGVRSMTLPNPPPSTLTASLQPSSTQASASAPVPAPASTQVPFAAPTSVATTTVPSGMKQSTSGDFSHYNRY